MKQEMQLFDSTENPSPNIIKLCDALKAIPPTSVEAERAFSAAGLFVIKLRTSDEAHFWLNGYVNKQNCRIWSEANPQVYVETPLHPEKLTVWCALWAGGILLQKR
ncbi:hypothetical protein TNCV_1449211 [Trichonephila clavipes]|nr:hypothetical protein TNCV_1449211 [Trichonephila clavipes]